MLELPDPPTLQDILGPGCAAAVPYLERALLAPVRELTSRPSKGIRARLVRLGAALVDQADHDHEAGAIARAAAAIELLHAGSLIVDDVQDGSAVRRGAPSLHQLHGVGGALCAGNWLYLWPMRLIAELRLAPLVEREALGLYREALEKAHYGQALDLAVRVDELSQDEVPPVCDAALTLKSGALTALAMGLGALLAGGDPRQLAAVKRFGERFGRALQFLDDLGNVLGTADPAKRFEDLAQRKLTGVWSVAAATTAPVSYQAFKAAARRAPADAAPLLHWMRERSFAGRYVDLVRGWVAADLRALGDALALPPEHQALASLQALGDAVSRAYA